MSTANRSFKYRLSTNVSAAAVYVTRAQKNAMSLSSTALNTKRNVNNWSKHTDWPTVIKFYLFVRMYQHIISIHKKKKLSHKWWYEKCNGSTWNICFHLLFVNLPPLMRLWKEEKLSLSHTNTHIQFPCTICLCIT